MNETGQAKPMKDEHKEKHFMAPDFVSDVVIGMADGLTVPFALAAGLSGSLSTSTLIVIAGLAEIAAGSIAMGLGGYLAARTEREHYQSEQRREYREVEEVPEKEREEVAEVFRNWGIDEAGIEHAVDSISQDKDRWVEFMMKYELGLEEPERKRARDSSLTIGISYIIGGIIPLSPYILIHRAGTALLVSVVITLIALFIFGWVKGRFTGTKAFKSAWQTTLVGGLAAGCAFVLARLIS